MGSNVNLNWMDELLVGTSRACPIVSRALYAELKKIKISNALQEVLGGGMLLKWIRSEPLSYKRAEEVGDSEAPKNIPKLYSSQQKCKPHKRFFWVEHACSTWFLRWSSSRKHCFESTMALAKLEFITRGDEVVYYDENSNKLVDKYTIMVLSGSYSIQLACDSKQRTLTWIAGLYHLSIHAKAHYAVAFISNTPAINALFTDDTNEGVATFKSDKLENALLDTGPDSIPDEYYWPEDFPTLYEDLESINIFPKGQPVEPLRLYVKKLLDLHKSWVYKLVTEIVNDELENYENAKLLLKRAAHHIKELEVDYTFNKDSLILYDPVLSEEESQELFYNVIRQHAVNIILDEEHNPMNEIDIVAYEQFLQVVQGADRNEIVDSIVNLMKVPIPLSCQSTSATIDNSTAVDAMESPNKNQIQRMLSLVSIWKRDKIPVRVFNELGFHWSLVQPSNSLITQMDAQEIINMLKYPIGCFWIASSHNTYLLGDQVGGTATAGALADALLRGCRCIELDLQDGTAQQPVLCHSWKGCQLTGSVGLVEALNACKEAAFVNSKLPVILSFEMHCSDSFLSKTALILKEILGDSLFIPNNENAKVQVAKMPLGCLLQKFLIKGKCSRIKKEAMSPGESAWQSLISLVGRNTKEVYSGTSIEINTVYAINENRFLKMSKQEHEMKRLTDACFVRVYPSGTRLASTNFCPMKAWSLGVQFVALNYQSCDRSMLLNIGKFKNSFGYILKPLHLRPFGNKDSEDLSYFYHNGIVIKIHVLSATQLPPPPNMKYPPMNLVSSFSNVTTSLKEGGKTIRFSELKKMLYEKDDRVFERDSGSEHEHDENENIQKESSSDTPDHEMDAAEFEKLVGKSAAIIMNHRETLCPYVEVSIVGESTVTRKTRTVNFNSFQPIWSDTTPPFEFLVSDPNEAILLLHVRHFDNLTTELVGQAAFPVSRLRPGIRWAQLLDSKFKEIECSGVLLHIEIHAAIS
ncbi:bifunctional C2 domain superfamily/Phospholipase C [Babesia duncani]|uniref:Phosphoinositide phospholipase C n=1 Tax=Babesia duncani TaxID=323732 RepID=A0AAD9PJH8_9APIC|nr:bifunctional C2 domain superfamily/Phospholipase C [Babesia duncani]